MHNTVIDGRSFFYQPIKNDKITYDKNQKIAAGQGDNYITRCLLDYIYFKENSKLIAIDSKKQQKLDPIQKQYKKLILPENLERDRNTQKFFITEKAKKRVLDFSKGTAKIWWFILFWYKCKIG